ncbi:hypothetical protein MY8738_007261 [Beauveria namnaoensis]
MAHYRDPTAQWKNFGEFIFHCKAGSGDNFTRRALGISFETVFLISGSTVQSSPALWLSSFDNASAADF